MKKKLEPIIFFGSGPVAAKSLRALYDAFAIEVVVTKLTPPHHHGVAPVAKFSEEKNLPTYYVRDKYELNEIFKSNNMPNNVKLGVLVDFGIIVSQYVIDYFELGIINSHFSLLPEWRGADPITFAVLSGQQATGVSLMRVVKALDEGPLIAQQRYTLPARITAPELTESLIKVSNSLLVSVLPDYISGRIQAKEQDKNIIPSYSRKLTKEDGQLDWHKDAVVLEREIRSFIEWPKSHAVINGLSVIITEAHVANISGEIGQLDVKSGELLVYCAKQALIIDRLKPAGKTEMSGKEFLRGYPIKR